MSRVELYAPGVVGWTCMLKIKPTVEQLLERIDRLERLIDARGRTALPPALSQVMERGKLQNDKRAREVLARTFGIVKKERGRAMLHAIEEARGLWK